MKNQLAQKHSFDGLLIYKLVFILFLLFNTTKSYTQLDSIILHAGLDTLYCPDASGYEIDITANDYCINDATGEIADCGPITIVMVDPTPAEGLGNIQWSETFISFEPNQLFLDLDTVIYIPYTVQNEGMAGKSGGFLTIALDPGFELPITICCAQTPCPGEMICNPEFSLPTQCEIPYGNNSYYDVGSSPLSTCWNSIQYTPNGNFGPQPGASDCGIINMWTVTANYSEGIQTSTPVVAGKKYLLSYTGKRAGTGSSLHNFFVGMTQNALNAIPNGPPSFLIHNQQNTTSTSYQQTVTCFTPNANYNNLVLYPQQSGLDGQPQMILTNVNMQEVPSGNQTLSIKCGENATLSAPSTCIPGAYWSWYNADNTPLNINGNIISVSPTSQNHGYYALLTFPSNAIQNNCSNIILNFTVSTIEECCCDDFLNSNANADILAQVNGSQVTFSAINIGAIAPDSYSWDFGDGSPLDNSINPTHIYNSLGGNYLVTLTITKTLSDGTVCKMKICQLVETLVTCGDCEKFLSDPNLNVSTMVDMSNWSTTGMVTIVPVPDFKPYNIMIWWDFNCDGVVDTMSTGNGAVTYNVPCGNSTICYSVECKLSQQVPCYARPFESTFNIPCDGMGGFCCADFMTDVMDFGIQGNGITGNLYDFQLSSNIPTPYTIDWDMDCDSNIDFTTNSISNQQITIGQNNSQLCAKVTHVSPSGEVCMAKVNTCLPKYMSTSECLCDSSFYNAVDDGFIWSENNPKEITAIPVSLLDSCDVIDWQWGDGSTSTTFGSSTAIHTYQVTGTYFVCMYVTRIDVNGIECFSEYCTNINVTMLDTDDNPDNKLTINPNPTKGLATIHLPDNLNWTNNNIHIRSSNGEFIKEIKISSAEMSIDFQQFSQGLYFISVVDKQGKMVLNPLKIVKQ